MRKTSTRKAGLASCMILAFSAGFSAPFDAHAQINPTSILGGLIGGNQTNNTTTTTTTNTTQTNPNVFQSLATGTLGQLTGGQININQASNILANGSVPGMNGTAANAGQYQNVLQSIMGGQNMNMNSVVGLLGGMASGQVNPQVGQGLAGINNLGNITSPQGMTGALGSLSGIINGLGGSSGGTTAQAGQLSSAISLLTGQSGASQLANTASPLNQAATQAISQNMPGLAGALGGTQGLSGGLAGLGSQIGAAIGGQAGGIAGGVIGGALGGGSSLTSAASSTTTSTTSSSSSSSSGGGGMCAGQCATEIPKHYQDVRDHVTAEFARHRTWFLTTYWRDNILPALMLMAEQLSAAGIVQVELVGAMLDGKQQLETQRTFQELQARAHKDYQPSEGMCTIGTSVRSLAASERKSDLTQLALSQRLNQRQTMSGDVVSVQTSQSDIRSRLKNFIDNYCDPADNTNGLTKLCKGTQSTAARRNIDVDYTRNVESKLTLDIDMLPPNGTSQASDDEKDLFALAANLYAQNIPPRIMPELLGNGEGKVRISNMERYLDLRAVFAKRSVAQNSFSAITAMRASGDDASAPYTKALIKELGVEDTKEIEKILGEKPSYFAQMEVLTKKLYQSPIFYTELYDKPANVQRKGAALQAIGLMQDRDLYNSLLRSEAVLSVLLETQLEKEQEKVTNAFRKLQQSGGSR